MRRYDTTARGHSVWKTVGVLLLALTLVVGAVAIFGVMQGWLRIERNSETTTIELDRDEFGAATDRASEASEKALQETGQALERAGEALQSSDDVE